MRKRRGTECTETNDGTERGPGDLRLRLGSVIERTRRPACWRSIRPCAAGRNASRISLMEALTMKDRFAKVAYGVGNLGQALFFNSVQRFLISFYTDTVRL